VAASDRIVAFRNRRVTGVGGPLPTGLDDRRAHEPPARPEDGMLRACFEQSPVPQAVLSLDYRLELVNAAYADLLGYDVDALIGRSAASVLHPDNGDRGDEHFRAVATGRESSNSYERVFQSATGQPVPVLVTASAVTDEHGLRCAVLCRIEDLRAVRGAQQELRRRDALARSLSQRAAGTAMVVAADGTVLYVLPTARRLLGARVPELGQRIDWSMLVAADREPARAACQRSASEPAAPITLRVRTIHGEPAPRRLEMIISNFLSDPDIAGLVINIHDVTEWAQTENALRASEQRYRLIAQTASDGIWASAADGTTLFANPRLAEILGLPLAAIYDGSVKDIIPPDVVAEVMRHFLHRHARGPEEYEVNYPHPDGGQRVIRLAATPMIDDAAQWVGSLAMISDVTEAREAEAVLRRRAIYDELTGLPNRALLEDRTAQALAEHRRRPGRRDVELLLIGIDDFKRVNEYLSHQAGDLAIAEVARRLNDCVASDDTLARVGGDEFAVLRQLKEPHTGSELVHRLLDAVSAPLVIDGGVLHLTASIGIADATSASDAATMLGNANAAMREAKTLGRGHACTFQRGRMRPARRRLDLTNELRDAISEDRLDLHYQPIIDLSTGRLRGVEALARWHDDVKGWLDPDEFVSIAEEAGLAPALDRWVIERACADAEELRRTGCLPAGAYVAVNISAANLVSAGIDDAISAATARHHVDAASLKVEITETALMTDAQHAVELLERLRDMGVGVAIDDFGTGYSSLSYLQRLPVDTLKIDRSFISGVTERAADRAIMTSIIDLARAVNVETVAEGIESAAQLECLQQLGCHSGQGWLWSTALTRADLVVLLQASGAKFEVRSQSGVSPLTREVFPSG
jgi:diguanylate cyclase (GGDEF)-like protein/PAS domain S-box-containing protein